MSKRKKIVIIAVIIAAVLFLGSCTALIISGINHGMHAPRPIRDVPCSYPDTRFAKSENPKELLREVGEDRFSSIDEALANSSYREELESDSVLNLSDEVLRFEDENAATVFYFAENSVGNELFLGYIFDKDTRGYSELRYILFNLVDENDPGPYTYENEDLVANTIVLQAVQWQGYARANDGKPTYIGVLEDESVYELRILGEAPTEIIKTEYEGQTYYIWYYEGNDFRQALIDDPVFDFSNFTHAEVIEVLAISF